MVQAKSHSNNNLNLHPFNGPKLHLYKKGSRRIKTSSATRSFQVAGFQSQQHMADSRGSPPKPIGSEPLRDLGNSEGMNGYISNLH